MPQGAIHVTRDDACSSCFTAHSSLPPFRRAYLSPGPPHLQEPLPPRARLADSPSQTSGSEGPSLRPLTLLSASWSSSSWGADQASGQTWTDVGCPPLADFYLTVFSLFWSKAKHDTVPEGDGQVPG